jgi:hypothetical protein
MLRTRTASWELLQCAEDISETWDDEDGQITGDVLPDPQQTVSPADSNVSLYNSDL